MNQRHKIAYFTFFIALMFIKVSSFHTYSHIEDDSNCIENCIVCEISTTNQLLPFALNENIEIAQNIEFPLNKSTFNYSVVLILNESAFYFHSRPPPAV